MFSDLRKMRLLCGLRQIDVAYCAGVSVSALAAAERGQKPLSRVESSLVVWFLNERWQALKRVEENYREAEPGSKTEHRAQEADGRNAPVQGLWVVEAVQK
jgi:hypothetical protein